MKAIIKNQIRLAIVAACIFLLGPTVFVAEETSMLASPTRTTPIDTFDRDDKSSKYHREALEETNEKKMKVEMNMIENIKKEDKEDIYDTMVASFDRVSLFSTPCCYEMLYWSGTTYCVYSISVGFCRPSFRAELSFLISCL